MNINDTILIESLRGTFAIILLFLTWLVGQRILLFWDMHKKHRELDIAANTELQRLYGEHKDTAKLWRICKRIPDAELQIPENTRWLLLQRSTAIESKCETLIVKLATERILLTEEMRLLGLFRQAFQQLRESIRDNIELASSSRGSEYSIFNSLIAGVAVLISNKQARRSSDSTIAIDQLNRIASYTLADYLEFTKQFNNPRVRGENKAKSTLELEP